jgi:hypothetical protein
LQTLVAIWDISNINYMVSEVFLCSYKVPPKLCNDLVKSSKVVVGRQGAM